MTIITPAEKRREKDFQLLRTRNPICLTCGYMKHPAAMEFSHLAPRKFHDDGGVQCCNCHREVSDPEKDFSYAPVTGNPMMETIARYLLALSEWLTRIGLTLAEFGEWLLGQAEHVLPYEPEADK